MISTVKMITNALNHLNWTNTTTLAYILRKVDYPKLHRGIIHASTSYTETTKVVLFSYYCTPQSEVRRGQLPMNEVIPGTQETIDYALFENSNVRQELNSMFCPNNSVYWYTRRKIVNGVPHRHMREFVLVFEPYALYDGRDPEMPSLVSYHDNTD